MTRISNLSEDEKEQLKTMIDAGQPLPPRYPGVLFAHPPGIEVGVHVPALFDFEAIPAARPAAEPGSRWSLCSQTAQLGW
jgi:hypothetical protein